MCVLSYANTSCAAHGIGRVGITAVRWCLVLSARIMFILALSKERLVLQNQFGNSEINLALRIFLSHRNPERFDLLAYEHNPLAQYSLSQFYHGAHQGPLLPPRATKTRISRVAAFQLLTTLFEIKVTRSVVRIDLEAKKSLVGIKY